MTAFEELTTSPRWVAWRNELRNDKATKVPYSPVTGQMAKSDCPATWADRQAAEVCAKRIVNGQGGGVGLMFGELGDGTALCGIDLDTCLAPDGNTAPWAQEVIERFGTYAEVSPSGTGIKAFFLINSCDLPALREIMGSRHGRQWKRPGGDHPPAIELHVSNRYYTVTEQHLPSSLGKLALIPIELLRWLILEAGPAFISDTGPRAHDKANKDDWTGSERDDREPGIVARVRAAMASSPFLARRWEGDWSSLADMSASGKAMSLGGALRRAGFDFADMCAALHAHPETAEWADQKGEANGRRELQRVWDKTGDTREDTLDPDLLAHPDLRVLRLQVVSVNVVETLV